MSKMKKLEEQGKIVSKVVSSDATVNIREIIEQKVAEVVAEIADESAKTYYRNVEIGFNVVVK